MQLNVKNWYTQYATVHSFGVKELMVEPVVDHSMLGCFYAESMRNCSQNLVAFCWCKLNSI